MSHHKACSTTGKKRGGSRRLGPARGETSRASCQRTLCQLRRSAAHRDSNPEPRTILAQCGPWAKMATVQDKHGDYFNPAGACVAKWCQRFTTKSPAAAASGAVVVLRLRRGRRRRLAPHGAARHFAWKCTLRQNGYGAGEATTELNCFHVHDTARLDRTQRVRDDILTLS